MEETLRYNVEIDGSSIQGQLSGITSSVTAGLNTAYAGVSGGVGAVAMAGDSLRQDLNYFFAPPPPGSGLIGAGGMSSNMLASQMGMQGGLIGPPVDPGLGVVRELDMTYMGGTLRTSQKYLGRVARFFGIQNRWGMRPRTMTEADYQRSVEESWQERSEEIWSGIKYTALGTVAGTGIGAVLGGAVAGFFTGGAGTMAGASLGAQVGGFIGGFTGEGLEELVDPGARNRRAIRALAGDLRMGVGGERFTFGERTDFARAVERATRTVGRDLTGQELTQALALGVETGGISRRGRNVEDMVKESREFIATVRQSMEILGREFEETAPIIAQTREKLGINMKQMRQFVQSSRRVADFTGRDPLEEMIRSSQVAAGLETAGMTNTLSAQLAPQRLLEAEAMVRSGFVTGFEARRVGGAQGIAQMATQTEAAFRQTTLGRAMLMAQSRQGRFGARMYALGGMSTQEFLSPVGQMTLADHLSFLGREEEINAKSLSSPTYGRLASDMLSQMGVEVTNDAMAGLLTQIVPGMTSTQAQVAIKSWEVQQRGPQGPLFLTEEAAKLTAEDRARSYDQEVRNKLKAEGFRPGLLDEDPALMSPEQQAAVERIKKETRSELRMGRINDLRDPAAFRVLGKGSTARRLLGGDAKLTLEARKMLTEGGPAGSFRERGALHRLHTLVGAGEGRTELSERFLRGLVEGGTLGGQTTAALEVLESSGATTVEELTAAIKKDKELFRGAGVDAGVLARNALELLKQAKEEGHGEQSVQAAKLKALATGELEINAEMATPEGREKAMIDVLQELSDVLTKIEGKID